MKPRPDRIPGLSAFPDLEARALADIAAAPCRQCARQRVVRKYQGELARRKAEYEKRTKIMPHRGAR